MIEKESKVSVQPEPIDDDEEEEADTLSKDNKLDKKNNALKKIIR